jgi:hypothetical protein
MSSYIVGNYAWKKLPIKPIGYFGLKSFYHEKIEIVRPLLLKC